MLLTMTNVITWEHQIKNKLTAFPDIGQAIRTKTPYVLAKPTIDDLIEDTNIRMMMHCVNDRTALLHTLCVITSL